MQHIDYQSDDYQEHRADLIKGVLSEINDIDENRFDARMKLKYIHKYNKKDSFSIISEIASTELEEQIAPLVLQYDTDEMAKRFDWLMYTIELATLRGQNASKPINRVIDTAEILSQLGNINKVRKQSEVIEKVQTSEFWDDASIFDLEQVRIALRDLIKYIEGSDRKNYYTNFKDEILSVEENEYSGFGNKMDNYKKRVNHYLKEHVDDMAIYKLRHSKKLNTEDIKHIEDILWHKIGSAEEYKKEFGDKPLTKLIVSIVGLDRQAVNELFSAFLSNETLSHKQMEFVQLVVNDISKNGGIEIQELNNHPYNKDGSVVELFADKVDIAKAIIETIKNINDIA